MDGRRAQAYVRSIRFVLDLLATVLLLPSSYHVDEIIETIAIWFASGNINVGQTVVDNIQQGTVARYRREEPNPRRRPSPF